MDPADSESDLSQTQQGKHQRYSPAEIKKMYRRLKGAVKPEDYFSDLNLFLASARPLTKKSGNLEDVLTDQEIYLLRKLIVKVRAQTMTDDDM